MEPHASSDWVSTQRTKMGIKLGFSLKRLPRQARHTLKRYGWEAMGEHDADCKNDQRCNEVRTEFLAGDLPIKQIKQSQNHRTNLPTYLPTYLPSKQTNQAITELTYLPTYLPI